MIWFFRVSRGVVGIMIDLALLPIYVKLMLEIIIVKVSHFPYRQLINLRSFKILNFLVFFPSTNAKFLTNLIWRYI